MKQLAAVIVVGTATVVVAAPRESVTFFSVGSVGLSTNPANEVRTAVFTGSDSGGAYTAKFLQVSGTVSDLFGTGSWGREAVIEITPPNGEPFVCAPLNTADYVGSLAVDAGRFALPIGTFSTAGTWTFRFAETYDDDPDGPDQTWESITFTLDDAPPPAVTPGGGLRAAFTNVPSNGTLGAGSTVRTSTFTQAGNATKVQIVGHVTGKTLVTEDNLYNVPNQARIRITPPPTTGLAPLDVTAPAGGVSAASVNTTVTLPDLLGTGIPVAGQWTFEFYESADDPAGIDAVWQDVSFTLQSTVPPQAVTMRDVPDGGSAVQESDFTVQAVTPAQGAVAWLRFTLLRDVGGTEGAVDIDMVGTNALPENDFSLGLYTSTGQLVAYSYDDGPGRLPQISIGTGTRARNGDGLPYDGQNHAVSPAGTMTASAWPSLPAGLCYIAVCSGNDGAVFSPSLWAVTPSTEANGGASAVVRVRYYRNVPSVVPTGAAVLNAGTLAGSISGIENLLPEPEARFRWIKFTLPGAAGDATGKYVDIDTAGTDGSLNDTNIALYNSAGVLIASNNDIVPGWPASNPTGGNSALSFGAARPPRNYRSLNVNMPAGDGRNGALAAGDYYLQISECCAGFGASRFWVMNDYATHQEEGSIVWHVHNNFGQACGPSDVGQQGGLPGNDNRLDNNDFIVFINLYFNLEPSADVGTPGGFPGQDGELDNNDFIVFIDQYFNAPGSCR